MAAQIIEEEDISNNSPSIGTRFEEWMLSDWKFGPYFWQTGEKPPVWRKVGMLRYRCPKSSPQGVQVGVWTGEKLLRGSEFVGEVVANIVGLNESDYQWVLDAAEAEERKQSKQRAVYRQTEEVRNQTTKERPRASYLPRSEDTLEGTGVAEV